MVQTFFNFMLKVLIHHIIKTLWNKAACSQTVSHSSAVKRKNLSYCQPLQQLRARTIRHIPHDFYRYIVKSIRLFTYHYLAAKSFFFMYFRRKAPFPVILLFADGIGIAKIFCSIFKIMFHLHISKSLSHVCHIALTLPYALAMAHRLIRPGIFPADPCLKTARLIIIVPKFLAFIHPGTAKHDAHQFRIFSYFSIRNPFKLPLW